MPPKLSLCMITKNEEKFLVEAINSVKSIVDEIIVVDTGSTDATVEIANSLGAKIFFFEWCDDFSVARNESLKHATGDWILVLDGDETISPQYLETIRKLVDQNDDAGYLITQRTYVPSKKESFLFYQESTDLVVSKKFPYFSDSLIVRLFKKGSDILFEGVVHELVENSLRRNNYLVSRANVVINHYCFLHQQRSKSKRIFYLKIAIKKTKMMPNDPLAHHQLGREYVQHGLYNRALASFRKSIFLGESVDEPFIIFLNHYMLGVVYTYLKKYDLVEKELLLSIQGESKLITPHIMLINYYEGNREFSKAADIYKSLAKIQIFVGFYGRARMSLKKCLSYKQDEEAAKLLELAEEQIRLGNNSP